MKIISWNVNGIRAWQGKEGTLDFFANEQPDIICLQETKAQPDQIENIFPDHPFQYINSAEKKGYSGTAIFSKTKPISESYGIDTLPTGEDDKEGRVITLEFENFYLVNVYTPNAKPDLARLNYRYDIWDKAFLAHLKNLERKKPVISCGDFNVAHEPIDLARPEANMTTEKNPGNAGFTDQERERFSDIINARFVDSYRYLYPEKIEYTWWSYRAFARERNVGWRIDYFLTSGKLKNKIKDAIIYDQITGSDHCPIGINIAI